MCLKAFFAAILISTSGTRIYGKSKANITDSVN